MQKIAVAIKPMLSLWSRGIPAVSDRSVLLAAFCRSSDLERPGAIGRIRLASTPLATRRFVRWRPGCDQCNSLSLDTNGLPKQRTDRAYIVSLSMRDHARFRSRKTGKPFDFIHLTVSLGIRCGGIWRVNEDVGEAGNLVLRLVSRET